PYTSFRFVLIDVVVRVAHALNLLGVFVRDFNPELFFKAHDQLNRVERVCAEIVDDPGIWRHFVFIDAKFVNDNLFYFLLNLWIGHSFFAPLIMMSELIVQITIASRAARKLDSDSTLTQRALRSIWRTKPLKTFPGPIS